MNKSPLPFSDQKELRIARMNAMNNAIALMTYMNESGTDCNTTNAEEAVRLAKRIANELLQFTNDGVKQDGF